MVSVLPANAAKKSYSSKKHELGLITGYWILLRWIQFSKILEKENYLYFVG